jgi:hypothetical protein
MNRLGQGLINQAPTIGSEIKLKIFKRVSLNKKERSMRRSWRGFSASHLPSLPPGFRRQKVKVFPFTECKILAADGFGLTERFCHVWRISPLLSREDTLRHENTKISKLT